MVCRRCCSCGKDCRPAQLVGETTISSGFSYFPNTAKTWLVTKEGFHDSATSTFANTGVNITTNGRPYLGAAIGSKEYVKEEVVKDG